MATPEPAATTSSTSEHAQEEEEDEAALLDPASYTAHRLHHGKPRHLHLTSRRVFIGPLPANWTRDQKQHFHYSKRAPTFSPAAGTGTARRVTGLDVRRAQTEPVVKTTATSHSNGDTQRSQPVAIPSSSLASTIRPTRRQQEQQLQALSPQTEASNRLRPQTGDTNTSVATARSRPKTSESITTPACNRGESFATANETWEHAEEFRRRRQAELHSHSHSLQLVPPIPVDDVEATRPEPPKRVKTEPIAETARTSNAGASTISCDAHSYAHDSLASLLKRDRELQERRQQQRSSDDGSSVNLGLDGQASSIHFEPSPLSIGGLEPTANIDGLEELEPTPWTQTRASTHLDRVSGGLVRFNTVATEGEEDRDRQALQKISGLDRARSLRLGRKRWTSRRDGEILKMESMLVRIEATQMSVPEEYDENESLKIDTWCADKWREYVVVCRESDNPDVPMVLRLYKSRTIPAVDKQHVSSHSTRSIPLDPKTTRVNLYSSLDKTLVVWLPHRRGTLIYIMRPRCSSSSVEWYSFLRTALGEPPCKSLQVAVPDLTLTITIRNPFDREEHALHNAEGDITAIEQNAVAGKILKKSLDMLEGVTEWEDVIEHWKTKERMGLAWRRYDRLEWVHGVNEQRMDGSIAMQKTHELELRPKTHYPTESLLNDGSKMTEPPPVEGFLVRLTSAKGRGERLGKKFQKKQYWATHDQFLCYCRPARAIPPASPKNLARGGVEPTSDEVPLIYSISPYELNENGDIEWLANPTPGLVQRKDEEAYLEAERKINLMLNAEGFVDLVQCVSVRRVVHATNGQPSGDSEGNAFEPEDETSFEIVLENGLILRLQAFDAQTRDEWILRLNDLITYWRARDRGDLAIVRRIRETNLAQLNMDEQLESFIGQFGRKWEVSSSTIASGELFNVCGLSSCRTITMSGILYRKPRRHSTFKRYNVILCNGELVIFHHTHRNRTGKEVPTTLHEKHLSLSLKDCYIYSGLVTASDLLYTNRTWDPNTPGRSALPRIYADGYTSTDDDTMTCFVLWHGSRRSIFTKRDEEGNKVRRKVTPLGQGGKSVVFKARSRLERDAWVMSIAMEIERLNAHVGQGEDVEVVTEEKKGWCAWKDC